MSATDQKYLDTIAALAEVLKPAVDHIEADSIPTTRNHYGKYLAIFGQYAKDAGAAEVLAHALIKAGGNVQGVRDGQKAAFG